MVTGSDDIAGYSKKQVRMSRNRQAGQSALEYSVLIAVIIAALVGMLHYMKRGHQGYMRTSADETGRQYDPRQTRSSTTSQYDSVTVERFENQETISQANGTQNRNSQESVPALN